MAMLLNDFLGIHQFIDWNILAEADKAPVIINEFSIGPFNLTQMGETSIFFKKFAGTASLVSAKNYLFFAFMVTLAAAIVITVISSVQKFWFYIGAALFSLFLVSLKLELLLLFDSNEKIGLVIALIVFLALSYYFNRVNTGISLIKRFVVFLIVSAALGTFFMFSTTINDPFFYISTSMITPSVIISVVFILSVSHEIVAGFAYLLFGTGTNTTKNGTVHFLIISIIYLFNVVLAYLYESGLIDWDILYINPYLLLTVSAILGIWGFRHREHQFLPILNFQCQGGILFLTFGIVTFGTISHFYSIGNDAGLEIFRDFILYGHMAYGLVFVLYLLGNFSGLLKSGLAIYKVIYKPTNMPYFTFRFAGAIVVVAFVLKANYKVPIFQNAASNFNSVADYHNDQGEQLLAERYYQEAAEYALYNHKSNYNLGILNERAGNEERAMVRFKEAAKKWPSPQTYVNLANLYEKENRFFDALFIAKEGHAKFPESHQLQTKLGLLYGATSLIDSAVYYLDQASKHKKATNLSSNLIALLAKNNISIAIDSIDQEYKLGEDPITVNNILALSNASRERASIEFVMTDSTLSNIDIALMNNSYINKLLLADTVDTKVLIALADHDGNWGVKETIEYLECLHLYKNGNVNKAFRKLNWMANTSEKVAAKYFDDIGLWALDQGAPEVAVNYFQWALERNYESARLHLAIAHSENNDVTEAYQLWQKLAQSDNKSDQNMALSMLEILSADVADVNEWPDGQKYLFSRYKLNIGDTTILKGLVSTISDPDYKAQAILDMTKKLWDRNLTDQSLVWYAMLGEMQVTNEQLYNEIQFFELKMLAHLGNIRGLAKKVNQGVTFDNRYLEKAFFTGLINEVSNDTTAAKQQFEYISDRNPFYPEATIAAARYIHQYDPFRAYDILLNAQEVNPTSIRLLEAYIYQCGRIQQNTSADIALDALEKMVTKAEYKAIEQEYSRLNEEAASNW